MSSDSSCSSSKLSTTTLVLLALLVSTEGFSLTPQRTSTPISSRISSSAVSRKRQSPLYYSLQEDEDDEDDDDEEEDDVMDVDSLGDWRTFRRNLVSTAAPMGAASQLEEFGAVVPKSKSVSKANELLLQSQNEALAEEYISGVWAHETSTVRTCRNRNICWRWRLQTNCVLLDWTGLDWTGLDWTGLDWT
jgi:hypothetical protein